MRVSVAICTLNRANALRNALIALRYQTVPDLEVVVVNGPSTDNTCQVLAEFADEIRVESCDVANLSVSRNIAIRASAGDIVAFLDDDAVPEFGWLDQSISLFSDPEVGGVGGVVLDHTGMALQYRYSCANRLGDAYFTTRTPYDYLSFPGAEPFPYLQGTNAIFRRSVLEAVGGFDEIYEYYLDETDLCLRIIDAGYVLRQLDDAAVHHKFLPSHLRNDRRVVTNEYPILKNVTYFGMRHGAPLHGERAVARHSEDFAALRINEAAEHERSGVLPGGSAAEAAAVARRAIDDGRRLGRERQQVRLGPVCWQPPAFKRFATLRSTPRRRVAVVSAGYGEAGTTERRRVDALCSSLSDDGLEVRLLTAVSNGHSTLDFENGVWVHRLATRDASTDDGPGIADDAEVGGAAVVAELDRIARWAPVDLVYGESGDDVLLGVLRQTPLPVVVVAAHAHTDAHEGESVRRRFGFSTGISAASQPEGWSAVDLVLASSCDAAVVALRTQLAAVDRSRFLIAPPARAGVAARRVRHIRARTVAGRVVVSPTTDVESPRDLCDPLVVPAGEPIAVTLPEAVGEVRLLLRGAAGARVRADVVGSGALLMRRHLIPGQVNRVPVALPNFEVVADGDVHCWGANAVLAHPDDWVDPLMSSGLNLATGGSV